METCATAGHPLPNWVGCVAAVVVTASIGMHVGLLFAGEHTDLWIVGITVAMVVFCAHCAMRLWRGPRPVDWALLIVANLVMLGCHWPPTGGHHLHGAAPVAADSASHPGMDLVTVVMVVEVAMALILLFRATRNPFATVSSGQ